MKGKILLQSKNVDVTSQLTQNGFATSNNVFEIDSEKLPQLAKAAGLDPHMEPRDMFAALQKKFVLNFAMPDPDNPEAELLSNNIGIKP